MRSRASASMQRPAPAAHRRVDRVPAASQLIEARSLTRGRPRPALARRPAPRPRQSAAPAAARSRDPARSRCPPGIPRSRAAPPALVQHQPRRPPERREVHQLHRPLSIRPQQSPPQSLARRAWRPRRRMWTPSGSPASSSTPSTSTSPSPTSQLTHTRRVALHRDPPVIRPSSQRRFWGIPRVQPRTPTPLTPTSFAKSLFVP